MQCVSEGRLLEAEEAQAKIEELRDQSYAEKRVALQAQNDSEMSELIQQREDQTREFEQSWQDHERKLEESAIADLQALEELHQKQLMEARESLDAQLGTVYKPSAKLLDNRKVFEQLVKQKKYAEAHDMRATIENMEVQEQNQHMQKREVKIAKAMEKVMAKHVIERNSLKKKLEYQKHEQKRLREVETIQLEKKFKNAIKEMQAKHNHSIVALDHIFEKTISNRPRYQPDSNIASSMGEKSMRSQMHSRKNLMSAKGGRQRV